MPDSVLERIQAAFSAHPGHCRVLFHVRTGQGPWVLESRSARTMPDPDLMKELRDLLGEKNVTFGCRQELPKLEPERRYPPRRP